MCHRERVRVYVSGKVQGVFFRANTQEQAKALGLDGWVKNLDDGRVEAVFEGDKTDVEEMIEWCHSGSPRANVTEVEVSREEPQGISGFTIKR